MVDYTPESFDIYNGWKNRETWLVNEHGFYDYDYVIEILERIAINFHAIVKEERYAWIPQDEGLGGRERVLLLALAETLEEYFDEHIQDETWDLDKYNPMIRELLRTATNRIDWLQIAERYSGEIHKVSEEVYLI